MDNELSGLKINVRGIVQGVGFRPFIYSLAHQYQLTGWVCNTSNGVDIVVNGKPDQIKTFFENISIKAPPLAHIDEIKSEACEPDGLTQFEILSSHTNPGDFLPISPDMSICPDCTAELFSPENHRYRYPFINCTNCGPRFTIIRDIPYDRPSTTMASFPMCDICQREYNDPLDRRFHAQPVACPECGPEVWFQTSEKIIAHKDEAIKTARDWIRAGKILAVKGLGGFHLVCDAENSEAVTELRLRKKRSQKPFAMMACDIQAIENCCLVSKLERNILESKEKPIVILYRRPDSKIAIETAPGQNTAGFMLPYTPLHLLLTERANDFPEVLVMTSGNISEEPIVYRDDNIFSKLNGLADAYLLHNRPIHMRVDDSVTRQAIDQEYILRRARGYAPDPIRVPKRMPVLLSVGAELKNSFCMTRDHYAFISHYIGDLIDYQTYQSFEEAIPHYEQLFRIHPQFIACDIHPDYQSTRYAIQRAETENLPIIQVQHHHAHLASCLADNNWNSDEPVIGLCLDGTGLGTDGAIWGGEIFLGNYHQYERLAYLKYAPMPGGDIAALKPARMALSHLRNAGFTWDDDLAPIQYLSPTEKRIIQNQLDGNINSPLTSSMGRLFDAVSSLLGICHEISYEGQAAIELENICDLSESNYYSFNDQGIVIDPSPVWFDIIRDLRAGIPKSIIAARFHNGISEILLKKCTQIHHQSGCNTVALSGGVWQNIFLLKTTYSLLQKAGFNILLHRQIPPNDGGISLGQAMVASCVFNE